MENTKLSTDLEFLRQRFKLDSETGLIYKVLANGSVSTKPAGGVCNETGYRSLSVAYQKVRSSRLVWLLTHSVEPKGVIDHINGDRSDDRPCNLRDVDLSINAQNRKGPNRNRLVDLPMGVYPGAYGRFQVKLMVRGKRISGGTFICKDAAAAKYLELRRLHGDGNTL